MKKSKCQRACTFISSVWFCFSGSFSRLEFFRFLHPMGCIVVCFLIEESNKTGHTVPLRCTGSSARDTFIPDRNWQEAQPWLPEECLLPITVTWLHLFVPGCRHFRNCYTQHVQNHPFNWLAGPGWPRSASQQEACIVYCIRRGWHLWQHRAFTLPCDWLVAISSTHHNHMITGHPLIVYFLCITKRSYIKIPLCLHLCDGDRSDHFFFGFELLLVVPASGIWIFISKKRWPFSKLAFMDCYIQKLAKRLVLIFLVLLLFFD